VRTRRVTIGDVLIVFSLSLFGLAILYPFYNTLLVSIVPQTDYTRAPFLLIPPRITWESYDFVFTSPLLLRSMGVSALLMVVGTAYNMLLTTTLAYALTKPIPGRRAIQVIMVFTMYFGGGLIPYYLLILALGLKNSFWVMVLPSVVSVTYLLVISNYFASLPPDVIESAQLDGAGELRILATIVIPLSLPILATFTLYYAVDRWNEWWNAMLFIQKVERWPLQLTLRKIISDANFVAQTAQTYNIRPPTYAEGVKMACIVITIFPLMALYPFLQRYFITGLTFGAVKG
jgi:putative aldouronate transport system permease protein